MSANTSKEAEPPSYEEVMRASAPPMQGKLSNLSKAKVIDVINGIVIYRSSAYNRCTPWRPGTAGKHGQLWCIRDDAS